MKIFLLRYQVEIHKRLLNVAIGDTQFSTQDNKEKHQLNRKYTMSNHRKILITVAFTQFNLEDKGTLTKVVEDIGTTYHEKYNNNCHNCEGNILPPKFVTLIARQEKESPKNFPLKQVMCTMLKLLYININYKIKNKWILDWFYNRIINNF